MKSLRVLRISYKNHGILDRALSRYTPSVLNLIEY